MLKAKSNTFNKVSIPWGAWHGDGDLDLLFPTQWKVNVHGIKDAEKLSWTDMQKGLDLPHGTVSLQKLAAGKQNAIIAVEDISRPCQLESILNKIVSDLNRAGLMNNQIRFVICNGAHAPMSKGQMIKKYGANLLNEFLFLNHNPYENLTDTQIELDKIPVLLNSFFYEADLKIAVGTIMPHSFAGFSSGAKLLLPGLSDIATLERTHKKVMMGFSGGVNDVEINKFRTAIEEVALKIGVDYFCGVVPNSCREIAGVFSGDIITAHRKGVDFARAIFETDIKDIADIAVLNSYPKDTELIQAGAALMPLKTINTSIIEKNGTFVIISKCSDGFGYHSLFGPGMRLYKKTMKQGMLKKRDLIVFSPGVNEAEFKTMYWRGYTLVNKWESVLEILIKKYPSDCKVNILPHAPLQLLKR